MSTLVAWALRKGLEPHTLNDISQFDGYAIELRSPSRENRRIIGSAPHF